MNYKKNHEAKSITKVFFLKNNVELIARINREENGENIKERTQKRENWKQMKKKTIDQ